MCVFFILLGLTVGIFAASLTLGKRKSISITLPSLLASLTVLLMYVGEACLLSGHLYLLGSGAFFEPLVGNFVSLADMLIIIAAGALTALCAAAAQGKSKVK